MFIEAGQRFVSAFICRRGIGRRNQSVSEIEQACYL